MVKRGFYIDHGGAVLLVARRQRAAHRLHRAAAAARTGPAWLTPLLKFFFTVSYVVLAAFVGAFADSMPKGKVMFVDQHDQDRRLRAALLPRDLVPSRHRPYWFVLVAYAVVGLGAAAYSPAKYGILTELLPPEQLVDRQRLDRGPHGAVHRARHRAGRHAHRPEGLRHAARRSTSRYIDTGVDTPPEAAILVIASVYLVAALFNLAIPDTGARYPHQERNPAAPASWISRTASRRCGRDKLGQISLAVTTLFWGAGATLQFIVLKWAEQHLKLPLTQGAMLQGVSRRRRRARRGARRAPGPAQARRARCCRSASLMGIVVMPLIGVTWMPLVYVAARPGGRAGRLLRGADERAAAAPRPRAALRGPFDRGAELQREREHPGDAGALCADDQASTCTSTRSS